MNLDIRTVLLCKIKQSRNNLYYNKLFDKNLINGESINNFITLGNYDALMVYDTFNYSYILGAPSGENNNILSCFEEEEKVLTELYESSNNGNGVHSFYHPLHIVSQSSESIVNSFWNTKTNCFALVLIYGTNERTTIAELENDITNAMTTINHKYLIYRSINLSELVVVCKDDSLKMLLEGIAEISYQYPNLQTHTICGFHYDINQSKITNNVSENDQIDMVKYTGTIGSHSIAARLFDELSLKYQKSSNCNYLAFGNNDFNLIYENVKTQNFIDMLNNWVTNRSLIDQAFTSVKTRVHVKYDKLKKTGVTIPKDTYMQNLIQKTQNVVLEYHKNYKENTDWIYPFVETLNMLSDMCNNLALSRVKYFVADTLWVFIKTLEELNSNPNLSIADSLRENELRLNSFVSGLNSLIERIVRVDGYLSQEPGYSPLIYNMVPAGILEYYCAYIFATTKIVNQFSDSGSTHKYYYAALPFPKLEQHIAFFDILPHSDQTNQVNVIEIPHKALYHPNELIFSITHEVMHFCGEQIRCRDKRYDSFLNFITLYLVHEFDLNCVRENASFCIKSYLESNIELHDNQKKYFDVFVPKIKEAVKLFYKDTNVKNRLQYILFEHKERKKEKFFAFDLIKWINARSVGMSLLGLFKSIEYLFKECYADLMTVLFLNIDACHYCKMIEKLNTPGNIDIDDTEDILRDAQIELRKALVIYAIGEQAPSECGFVVKTLLQIFKSVDNSGQYEDDAYNLARWFCEKRELVSSMYTFNELFFNVHCLMEVIEYLKQCVKIFKLLKTQSCNRKWLNELKIFYETGIDLQKFFNNQYCDLVYEIRNEINNKIKNAIT